MLTTNLRELHELHELPELPELYELHEFFFNLVTCALQLLTLLIHTCRVVSDSTKTKKIARPIKETVRTRRLSC